MSTDTLHTKPLPWWFFDVLAPFAIAAASLAADAGVNWTTVDWPEWLGAIGTILAFGGTIWLSTEGERRREADALMSAKIRAVAMRRSLLNTDVLLDAALSILENTDVAPDFEVLAHLVKRCEMPQIVDFTPFQPLPRLFALRLATGLDTVRAASAFLDQIARHVKPTVPHYSDTVQITLRDLRHARSNLSDVLKECTRLEQEVVMSLHAASNQIPPVSRRNG